jgi:hypothetical protein
MSSTRLPFTLGGPMDVRSVALDRLDPRRTPCVVGGQRWCRRRHQPSAGQNESHEDFGRSPIRHHVPVGLNFWFSYAPPSSISWSSVVTSMQPPMLRATGHRAGWALWARSIAARSASGDTFSS